MTSRNAVSRVRFSRFVTAVALGGAIAAAFLVVPVLAAPESESDASHAARELAGIRVQLDRIAALLEEVGTSQQLQALMTRIRLKQQRLSSAESAMRTARTELRNVRDEIGSLAAVQESWRREFDTMMEEGLERDERRRELAMLEARQEQLEVREEELVLRVTEAEDDFAEAREDIEILEASVDERLGLR